MASSEQRSRPRLRTADTFWARLSPTARHGTVLAILLVVALSFYSPVIFGGKTIQSSDQIGWRAKVNALMEYHEKTGEWALWNPNVYSGMPTFMMNYKQAIPQVDDIADKARSVAWPVSHLFFLLLGTYLLVFYLTRNHLSGLLSAIAFGFTTYIPVILSAGHNTKFIALAYAPFVVLTFIYTLRKPSVIGGLLFAVALAAELRAKHPQITYSVLMMLLVWWIVEVVWAWQEEEYAPLAKSTGWLALGTGLALLMVAQPYLAIYQYKQYSVRGGEAVAAGTGGGGGGGMGWQKAMAWSQGPKELFTLFVADAFGGGGRMYWGPKTFTQGPHYIGGVVMALSGLAVWRVRNRVTWGFGAGVLVTILFGLGKYAAWLNWPMFQYFPFFDAFRAPETWLSVSALGLAVLAGIGLDYCLRREERGGGSDRTESMLYAFGAVAGIVLLALVGKGVFFDFEHPRETQVIQQIRQRPNLTRSNPQVRRFYQQLEQRKEQRREAFTADAMRTLFALGVVVLVLWLYRRRTLSATWLAGGIVALVVLVDLWGVDREYLGEDEFSSQPSQRAQIPTYDFNRFIEEQVKEAGGPGHFRVYPYQTPYAQNPMNNAISSYYYQSVGGAHPAKLQRYQVYIDHILRISQKGPPNENALDLMNARYIVAGQRLPGTSVVFKSKETDMLVLQNEDAVPRGFFVGQTEVVGTLQKTWQRLRDPSFDPRQTALLPQSLDAPVTPIDSASTATATLESYSPEEITWSLETDAPRLFVASEVYYPAGWNAYLDGEQVPIHRVDYLLRGVHVPAGEHKLVMRFEPKADRYGTLIAGGTTALVYGTLLILLGLRFRRRWRKLEDTKEEASTEES